LISINNLWNPSEPAARIDNVIYRRYKLKMPLIAAASTLFRTALNTTGLKPQLQQILRRRTMATYNTNTSAYKLNHTMLRVKDPAVSGTPSPLSLPLRPEAEGVDTQSSSIRTISA
jgi:hypothetical protein